MTLTALYRYPVKSLRGAACTALDVDERGLRYDRHWMVVDRHGRFLTQRQCARMALIETRVDGKGVLHLQAAGVPVIRIAPGTGARRPVQVWQDRLEAVDAGDAAADWLSGLLAIHCRLVHFDREQVRPVDPAYAGPADEVGFADGFPFLLISQGSLDALNARLARPVPMLRFRPNLVIGGCPAHAEDHWRRVRIGDLTLRVVKPCARCIVPTIDPDTAQRGREPLHTLSTYRRHDNRIYFGQNLVHDRPGRLEVGMPVDVLG